LAGATFAFVLALLTDRHPHAQTKVGCGALCGGPGRRR
jgi:hypothetical protein